MTGKPTVYLNIILQLDTGLQLQLMLMQCIQIEVVIADWDYAEETAKLAK